MIENMKAKSIDFDAFLDMMTARISDGDNKDDILKVFRLFDDDDSGAITLNDLLRVARELGETMTQAELKEMIDRADLDGDGVISPEEFVNIMQRKVRAHGAHHMHDDTCILMLIYCCLWLSRCRTSTEALHLFSSSHMHTPSSSVSPLHCYIATAHTDHAWSAPDCISPFVLVLIAVMLPARSLTRFLGAQPYRTE